MVHSDLTSPVQHTCDGLIAMYRCKLSVSEDSLARKPGH